MPGFMIFRTYGTFEGVYVGRKAARYLKWARRNGWRGHLTPSELQAFSCGLGSGWRDKNGRPVTK